MSELRKAIGIAVLAASITTLAVAQETAGSSIEPTITGAKIQGKNSIVGGLVGITIEFNTKEVPKPWCGFEISWGDGDTQEIRAGHDGADSFPLRLSHSYRTPGQFNLRISGKYISRGFKSASACAGGTKQVTVTVVDAAEDKAKDDALKAKREVERAKDETDRKARELEAKEAELRQLAERLENERKAQGRKEQALKAQQRIVEAKERQAQAQPATPKQQPTPSAKPSVDPF